jgi:hypothetical protein
MSYQKDRDMFIAVMTGEGVPLETSRLILRGAATINRLSVDQCNRALSDKEKRIMENAANRMAERLNPYDIKVTTSGDPRGYTTKLLLPSERYNTWGGAESGWGVPVRDY